MSKKKKQNQEEVKAELNMSPMIDCCFLLLIFFVVNATQITVSKDPSIMMPNAIKCDDLKDANGCIVVNVFPPEQRMDVKLLSKFAEKYGGSPDTIWWSAADAGGKSQGFANDPAGREALADFIKKQRTALEEKPEFQGEGKSQIRLYLRGDANTPWLRSSLAITCAAKAGVNNIVFGTFPAKN